MTNNKYKKQTNPFVIQSTQLKDKKIKDFSYRKQWLEDSFVIDNNSNQVRGKTFNLAKLKIINLFFIFFLFILMTRIAYLQVLKGDYYYSMAEGNRIRIERVEAKRGVVYDRNLKPLIKNVANFILYFIPIDLPKNKLEKDKLIKRISEILNSPTINEDYIKEKLSKIKSNSPKIYEPLFITDNIDYEKSILLYLESEQMPGVVLSNKTRREYLSASLKPYSQNNSLSHVLGYVGNITKQELKKYGEEYLMIDYVGKTGLERFWENELKGMNGLKYIEVDALGKEKKIISTTNAEDGHNLILTLDLDLQEKTEEIIKRHAKKYNFKKISTIVMDPNNGEILSLVSFPDFNNNAFTTGISTKEYQKLINNPAHPLFNRAISGMYPSGSTIKPIIAIAALEEGLITEKTSFNSVGGIKIDKWIFPDWSKTGHGYTDVRKAIAMSVNTFFYYIGGGYKNFEGLGVDRIIKYAKLFGLGKQTGIDIVEEASGFLPTKKWKEEVKNENWYIGDTYHLAIGQGDLLVTPLQVANFTAVFANQGQLVRPHLVKEILTSDDQEFMKTDLDLIRKDFINSYKLEVVRQGMRQTVTSGSAKALDSFRISVAGKTGTAQWSSKNDHHAWFTCFAPYTNAEVVITVLVEEGGEGSQSAIPIAREILEYIFE